MLKFGANEKGGVAIYTAMLTLVGLGAGGLATDYGRLTLLRSEMQHAADAAALAGVVHLIGNPNARASAEDVARNSMTHQSNIPSGGPGTPLAVANVRFYSSYNPTKVVATGDLDAKVIEIEMAPQTVTMMFAPILNMFSPTASTFTFNVTAVAEVKPYICNVPPLMMCDPGEVDPAKDPTLPGNIGKQVRLVLPATSSSPMTPGNFGLLALPDGSLGASAIEGALGAILPNDCYEINVITATGAKTAKVQNGINTRFDISSLPNPPAPNVINYPLDASLIADPAENFGDGVWDIDNYWLARHGIVAPADLAAASRYQAYLYELGLTFARNGKHTVYPIPSGGPPAGYVTVTPPGQDLVVAADPANAALPDFDGVPQNTPAANGQARRLYRVALLQCIAEGITGTGTYPTYGKYVEMFLTQEVRDANVDSSIYAEIVRSVNIINDPEFHTNAGLVQ